MNTYVYGQDIGWQALSGAANTSWHFSGAVCPAERGLVHCITTPHTAPDGCSQAGVPCRVPRLTEEQDWRPCAERPWLWC